MLFNYDRSRTVSYALKWALSRNPKYYDFENIGGDCTSFVSQCLFEGCGVMNYAKHNGWYYIDLNNRAPSWSGVEFLKSFLLTNKAAGVYGELCDLQNLLPGDVIMLSDENNKPYHSVIVSGLQKPVIPQNIFICSHTYDRRNARLSDYHYYNVIGIHISGARNVI